MNNVYAYTPNGREIREIEVVLKSGKKVLRYEVQPYSDNYWKAFRTPLAALKWYEKTRREAMRSYRLKP